MATTLPHAMSMIDDAGILSAMPRALRYAGNEGRVATLPDIITARVQNAKNAWDAWYTTSSSFYFGFSRGGNPIIIISHGTGPLMDPEVMESAYNKRPLVRNVRDFYGRIDKPLFRKLESGEYGDGFSVLDAARYLITGRGDEYDGSLNSSMQFFEGDLEDPMLRALFGSGTKAYLSILMEKAKDQTLRPSYQPLVLVKFESEFFPRHYVGNFLTLEYGNDGGLSLQDRRAAAKFVAVRDKKPIRKIHKGVNIAHLPERVKGLQSKFDSFRQDVDLLVEMAANGIL